jgi:hypothetical protein
MTSRKKPIIKNFAKQEERPSRQFLDVIKSMLNDNDKALQAHSWHYRAPRAKYALFSNAYNEIEKSLLEEELSRQPFVLSLELTNAYRQINTDINAAEKAVRNIQSGKVKRELDDEVIKLGANLHTAQNKLMKTLHANDIDIFRKLRIADSRLKDLQAEATKKSICLPSKRQQHLQQMIAAQKLLIINLEAQFAHDDNPVIIELQKSYDAACQHAKDFVKDSEAMLAKENQKLLDARSAFVKIVDAINEAQMSYHAHIKTQSMRDLIGLYDTSNDYLASFMSVVKDNLSYKAEAASYLQQMDASKSRLEQIMSQLWSDDFGKMSDMRALASGKPNVSAAGLFKKEVNPITAEKRKFLIRVKEDVAGKVIFKI